MKILFITNMWPSKQKSYAGIFVKNQYEELQRIKNKEDRLDIFYMKRSFTSKARSLVKYALAFIRFIPLAFKKYDVIHVHYFYPLILLAYFKKKIHKNTKIVVTFLGRDINAQVNSSNQDFFKKIAKAIDFSIPVGKTLSQQVEKKLDLSKIKILPCGVNKNVFYNEDGIEKEYDFTMVGSFIHRKGIDTVIEAIQLLPKETSIKFCFCGSGDYLNKLKKLQKNYNILIKQNQSQDELRRILNSSRFFLLMSRAEGFATAITEAFFCGLPVITSDIKNFREQVNEDINGYTLPLGNAAILQNKFLELSKIDEDKYHKLEKGANESFRNASLQYVCSDIYSIYKDLLK